MKNKRWAQDYDCCVRCGETKRRHLGHGICQLCWQRDKASDRKRQLPPRIPIEFNDNQRAMLLFAETKEKYGYEIESLSYGTPRKVVHKCDVCGQPKETPFREFMLGQKTAHFKCKTQKAQKTNLKRYGVKHPCQSIEIQQKIQQTFLKNYGVPNSQLSPEVRKKKEETNLQRYGVRNPLESSEIWQKTRQSLQEHYGVEHPGCSLEIQERMKRGTFKKYGVEHPLQSSKIREKWNQTNKERYSVEYPAQSPEILKKMKQTTFEEYGVESYTQLPGQRNKLSNWCRAHPEKLYTSKGELEMLEWVKQYYPSAKKYKGCGHEIDVYIPDINLGIEYNGLFWHQESVVGKDYHLNKTKCFEGKNIRVIHIFEHEWKCRQEQVKSLLLTAMNKNEHQVHINECNVQWSSNSCEIGIVHKFLEDHHLQKLSLHIIEGVVEVLHNCEILAAATFGRCREGWRLIQFCTKFNYIVQDGIFEVSKLASKHLKSDIVSWVDYRLDNGRNYEKAGWVFEKLIPPSCFYGKSNGIVISKHSKINKEGLPKVYDCGKMKYRYLWSE